MDNYLLRYFVAVAEIGNFSKAAARLNVTQPTLSAGIAKLEAGLGVRLFTRNNRRVAITPAGGRLLPRAQHILQEVELAKSEAAGARAGPHIRMGLLSSAPVAWLISALRAGGVQDETVEVFDGVERDLLARLDRGQLDAAISLLRPGLERYVRHHLFTEGYSLVLPETHRLGRCSVVGGQELLGEPMIIRRHCEGLAQVSRYFTGRGVRPNVVLKTTSDERAFALVRAGLGVTVAPDSVTFPGTVRVRIEGLHLTRDIGLLVSESVAPAARRMLEAIVAGLSAPSPAEVA